MALSLSPSSYNGLSSLSALGGWGHDNCPCSFIAPQFEHLWVKMHSLPYGQPPGALLRRRHIPLFHVFFAGGLTLAPPLLDHRSSGLLPFPVKALTSDTGCPDPVCCCKSWTHPCVCRSSRSATSNGSDIKLGPGRQETYCHGSSQVHDRSSEAAISIWNCMSYSSHANLLAAFWYSRSTVWRWATMHGIISADFFAMTAIYRVKHLTQVIMSITRCCPLCPWAAWNWLRAPTRLSWRVEADLPCSASLRERGAGRNSSMSTYSPLHTFSTVFIGRVGRPFAVRYRDGFGSVLSFGSPPVGSDIRSGSIEEKGLFPESNAGRSGDLAIVGRPIPSVTEAGGSAPSGQGVPRQGWSTFN